MVLKTNVRLSTCGGPYVIVWNLSSLNATVDDLANKVKLTPFAIVDRVEGDFLGFPIEPWEHYCNPFERTGIS